MKKHLEEIFELQEKDIDPLMDEAERYSFDIEQDLQAEAWEMHQEDSKKLGIVYNAIKSKALSEKMAYLETKVSFFERAIELEAYEKAGETKQLIEFFVHSFLEEVPAKSLGLPTRASTTKNKR